MYNLDGIQEQYGLNISDTTETDESISSERNQQNRQKVLKSAVNAFSKAVLNIKFTPDTIVYKGNCYLIKDNSRDITVYYNNNNDIIFGLYKGFNK